MPSSGCGGIVISIFFPFFFLWLLLIFQRVCLLGVFLMVFFSFFFMSVTKNIWYFVFVFLESLSTRLWNRWNSICNLSWRGQRVNETRNLSPEFCSIVPARHRISFLSDKYRQFYRLPLSVESGQHVYSLQSFTA